MCRVSLVPTLNILNFVIFVWKNNGNLISCTLYYAHTVVLADQHLKMLPNYKNNEPDEQWKTSNRRRHMMTSLTLTFATF